MDEIPVFNTLEEERAYWERRARGPGRPHKPTLLRNSFLSIRLTGKEITQLRDLAATKGIGPSTFVREMIIEAIDHHKEIPKVKNAKT